MKIALNCVQTSHGTFRVPWLTLSISAAMIALFAMGSAVFDLLVMDKNAILSGEYWRLITGHFVHMNSEHLFWDLLAFVVIGSVIEINKSRHLISSFVSSCLFVSVWIMVGETALASYCGLSGALNGMLVLAAILQWKATGERKYLLALALTLVKIAFELSSHQTVFTSLASQAVPSSHAAGYVAGVIYLLLNSRNHLSKGGV